MSEATDDAALVAAIGAGDRDALAALYDRFAGGLLGLAARVLADRREAEDLLHDVFIEVWRQAAGYDARRGTVRAWLYTRLRARALDRARARRFRPTAAAQPAEASTSPDELAPDRRALLGALRSLPPEQCDVIALAYFEGLSSTEISGRLGIPVGTVKSRTAAALGRLRAGVPRGAPGGSP